MRDKNARRWFWLAMILALIVGLACEGEDGAQTPDRTTRKNTKVDQDKQRAVSVSVHGNGPYTVVRMVSGPDEDGRQQTEKQTREVAGGEYKAGYKYNSGTRINVKVQVFGHAKDMFDCEITDAGSGNRDTDRGKAQAYCELWTTG